VYSDGITWDGGGQIVVRIPKSAGARWVQTNAFQPQFRVWVDAVKKRDHVFLGYSSKARQTANDVLRYLQSIGVTVRDWETHFHAGGTILDEIRDAACSTLGGIFLFTHDDDLVSGDTQHAAPRDNVIFEAGYFMQAKGRDRIREQEAKIPADVGGSIYLSLQDRSDIRPIQSKLRDFVETRL
jgi:predicted nucleotide-binding protein